MHKTGHEMSNPDWEKAKQMILLLLQVFYGRYMFFTDLLQNDSTWLLETHDSERRRGGCSRLELTRT